MNEIMTIEEIEERFDSEWVLLEDPETGPYSNVLKGKLLWHGKDRDELERKAMEFHPRRSAVLYTGKFAEGEAFLL